MRISIHPPRLTALCPSTPDQLWGWLHTALGLQVPRKPALPHHAAPFDYLLHTFFERGDCIVWASRGGGKTFLGAVATTLDLLFKPGIQVRILGGSLEQSRRMHEHLRTLFARPALAEFVAPNASTTRRLTLRNGSAVEVLAASHTSVRGTRIQKLRCDEVELFDRDIWQAAQLCTRSMLCPGPWGDQVRGSIEALSTMHKPHGIMWDLVGASGTPALRAGPASRATEVAAPSDLGAPPSERATSACSSSPPSISAHTPPHDSHQPAPASPPLFRWSLLDTLARCGPAHTCDICVLQRECAGSAKLSDRVPGHVPIADAVAMKQRVSADAWDAEMLCLTPRVEHAVYPAFAELHITHTLPRATEVGGSATTSVLPSLPSQREGPGVGESFPHSATLPLPTLPSLLAALDFGIARSALLLAHLDNNDNTLTILDEVIAGGRTIQHQLDTLRAWSDLHARPITFIAADPAGLQRSEQTLLCNVRVLRDAGYDVRTPRFPIMLGIDRVRARLAPAANPQRPTLFFHHRCAGLIEALRRYRFDPAALLRGDLTPIKDGHDHPADALRYLVTALDAPHHTTRAWHY